MAQVFNTANFAWKDVKVFMGGRLVTGIRGLKFKITKDLEAQYGAGDEPHNIGEGNKAYTVELMLTQAEIEAMAAAVQETNPNGDLTDGEWDVTANFSQSPSDKMSTHRAVGVKFSEMELGMSQGDKSATVTLPGLAMKIYMNV